jgi:hypothetical protein
MKKKPIVLVRINSRIRPDQLAFIKRLSKKGGLSEGEIHRNIIDSFMNGF